MPIATERKILLLATALLWAGSSVTSVFAQFRIDGDAVSGERFGVGRLRVQLPEGLQPELLGIEGLGLTEKSGRALYPVIHAPALGGLVKDVLDSESPLTTGGPVRQQVGGLLKELLNRPPSTTVYFLFRGRSPLELTLQARSARTFRVTPRDDPRAHRRLLSAWWQHYAPAPRLMEKRPDYPPLIESYLRTQLARRLDLRLPTRHQTDPSRSTLEEEIGLMLGTEAVRIAMQQDRLLGLNDLDQLADQPLPEPIAPPELQLPEPAAEVPIEPIAMRVPVECFYIRFGSFANFLWLQDTLARWGGDAQNLIASRGLDYELSQRIEEQLVLKQTALSRLLGDTVIADVAVIGTDLLLREGAAFGVLFHARNNTALAATIAGQRLQRLAAGGASERKVEIGGRQVSLLISPDGQVRSYYVSEGDYHFVTCSKTLVRRFLETASGALGTSKEFRHARTLMPLARQDTIFMYVSDAFLRHWVSPQYRVEMARRLQATADIDLVQLAKLTAASEGLPARTVDRLSAVGLLPLPFGPRPDGSRTVLEGGEVYDSLRGRRGALLPVPDVPVSRVTAAEASAYRRFADFYREKWGRIDPIMVGLKRRSLSGNRELVVVDARTSPLGGQLHDFVARWTGPPDKLRLAPVPGDLAAAEMVLKNQRIFAGLRDFEPPLRIIGDRLLPAGRLRDLLVGYVGFTGEIGLLDFLDARITARPNDAGYAGRPTGLSRRQLDQFTVFSLHPDVLKTVMPQLHFENAERPAQVRVRIGDPSQARMASFLNAWGYTRTRQTSLGNLRLMHALDQQLRIPPEDCKEAAEFLLGAKLICPLGGKYVLKKTAAGASYWTSTALADGGGRGSLPARPPDGYQAPPLNWFRGLELDATVTEKSLSAHAEITMQLPEKKKK